MIRETRTLMPINALPETLDPSAASTVVKFVFYSSFEFSLTTDSRVGVRKPRASPVMLRVRTRRAMRTAAALA